MIRQAPTFVFCLVSLACRGPCAETLHWVRFPSSERLCLTHSQPCTQALHMHLNPRWQRQQVVCREVRPALNSTLPPNPPPRGQNPTKQPYPLLVRESMPCRARPPTSAFSDPIMKLSFASEPNSVLFYWCQQEDPYRGLNQ